jgi:hypothetical protein
MQPVFALMMFVAMCFFVVCWALKWVDLAPDFLVLTAMVGLALTSGLYFLGGALVPSWERGLWRDSKVGLPASGLPRVRIEMGRLVFLGSGIWFTTIGLGILAAGVLGENGLPTNGLFALFGGCGIGLAIFLVGLKLDQRRLDSAREFEEGQWWADLHP